MIIEPSCSRNDLLNVCHQLLEPWRFKDYCPNGLQVEGIEAISRVALAVTANQAAIDAAINWNAHALITHHGLIWKGEDGTVTGFRRNRLHRLLSANLNVLAYHLPLDAHPTLGNNRQLAQQLDLFNPSPLNSDGIVWTADIPNHSANLEAFIQRLKDRLNPSGGGNSHYKSRYSAKTIKTHRMVHRRWRVLF